MSRITGLIGGLGSAACAMYKYVVLALGVVIGLVYWYFQVQGAGYEFKIGVLEGKVEARQIEMLEWRNQAVQFKSSIQRQNQLIDIQKAEYDALLAEYEDWKGQPVEVKYETVNKYITVYKDRNVTVEKGECRDTKNVIDGIKLIDFSAI